MVIRPSDAAHRGTRPARVEAFLDEHIYPAEPVFRTASSTRAGSLG